MIRVGLVGYGLAGAVFHAPLIRSCGRMELSAVQTSRDVPLRVRTLDELLERSDLVVVATPNPSHFEIAAAALKAGKHVVVDKPFTVSSAEADKLIALAKECRRMLTVFHNRRWDSDFLTLRKVLPQLGEIMLLECHWDRFRPKIKQGWREEVQTGSGLLFDLGPHLIDQALLLFGLPDSISADIIAQRASAKTDDYFDLTLEYGRKRVALRSSSLIISSRPRFALYGTGGSFVSYGLDPQEEQLKNGEGPRSIGFGLGHESARLTLAGAEPQAVASERGNYLAFYEAVAASILEGDPVPVDPADARAGLILIDLARRSAELGQRLAVPGASWT